jgi:hypothetical protein
VGGPREEWGNTFHVIRDETNDCATFGHMGFMVSADHAEGSCVQKPVAQRFAIVTTTMIAAATTTATPSAMAIIAIVESRFGIDESVASA